MSQNNPVDVKTRLENLIKTQEKKVQNQKEKLKQETKTLRNLNAQLEGLIQLKLIEED